MTLKLFDDVFLNRKKSSITQVSTNTTLIIFQKGKTRQKRKLHQKLKKKWNLHSSGGHRELFVEQKIGEFRMYQKISRITRHFLGS
jgi:hypothetical protein